MKKGWKIALISLASLLGLVVIAVVIVCWLLFTPARLTSIVNKLSSDYILCENHFDKVSLSLFKTWPDVGLEVEDVVLINPYELPTEMPLSSSAVHNDTLARIGSLTVGLDLKAFLHERAIIVRQLRIADASASLYTAPDGWSNLDIFPKSEDGSDADTSSSTLRNIQLEKIVVDGLDVQYCNLQSQMLAQAHGLDLKLKGSWVEQALDADLSLDASCILLDMRDSVGAPNIYASLEQPKLCLDAKGTTSRLEGKVKLDVPNGRVKVGDKEFVTDAMRGNRHDLLQLKMPFVANWDNKSVTFLPQTCLSVLNYDIDLDGDVSLANDTAPMQVDVQYQIDGWQVEPLLEILPSFVTKSLKGMDVDAKVDIKGTAKGVVASGRLPLINAEVSLRKGAFSAPSMLPMPVKDIDGEFVTALNLSSDSAFKGPSRVTVNHLSAKTGKSNLSVSGNVEDLLDDMLLDVKLQGNLSLPDVRKFLPDTMPVVMQGTTKVDLNVNSRLSQITALHLEKVKAKGTLRFSKFDVVYDSIHARSPQLALALTLPKAGVKATAKARELIDARITGGQLDVDMQNSGLNARVENPDIRVGMPNILDKKQSLAAAFNIASSKISVQQDSMLVYTDTIKLKGSVRNDKGKDNVLKQWNPNVDIDIHRGVFSTPKLSEAVRLTNFVFNYKPEVCDISRAEVLFGVSDYHLSGKVYGLEDWLSHTAMLHGTLDFGSQYADIDQLLDMLSGLGSDPDTLAQQRVEDNVPKEAKPFIVPKDVNVCLNTHIQRCVAFGNDLTDLGGSVTVNDGVAVVDQMGFTCKAARMQLTGIYKSPRVNHLFVGLDFHLLDIDIDELLDMIPTIDTLVPMLSAFDGRANFHLAAECNLDAYYKPKMSTLIGAAAISGKDLVVLDNASLATIAKLLQFKNWREKDNNIGIDSISVEAQVFRKEIIVYPFLLNLHNYQLCIGGRHTLDNNCNYHLELLKCPLPARLAVDVKGNLSKPQISLGKVQYAELYKPEKRDELQTRTLELKKLVRQALEKNVR